MNDANTAATADPARQDDDAIRFVLDGKILSIADLPPTTTVLEFLREHLGRTGTKEGCAEGDCGACTVVLGERIGEERMRYRAINSCIRFLPTIDGKELVTVESLAGDGPSLHPVQQAMALGKPAAIAIASAFLAGGWLVYDALCRSPLGRDDRVIGGLVALLACAAAWGLCALFSGRGAYIVFGAMASRIRP